MKYLESAIKFLLKYWILALPLFVLTAIATLVSGGGASTAQLGDLWSTIGNPGQLTDPGNLIKTLPAVLPAIAGGGILAFLFNFVSIPATYGLVNKGLETGTAGLNDIGPAVTLNVFCRNSRFGNSCNTCYCDSRISAWIDTLTFRRHWECDSGPYYAGYFHCCCCFIRIAQYVAVGNGC